MAIGVPPLLQMPFVTPPESFDSFQVVPSPLPLQAELGVVTDFLESYELVAFDVADADGGGNEVVAGAVHGGRECWTRLHFASKTCRGMKRGDSLLDAR